MSGSSAVATDGGENHAAFSFKPQSGLPELRRDLQIIQVSFRRRKNWVVKDPASLRYFRWGEWDYRVAKLLDGKRSLAKVEAEMSRHFGVAVNPEQLQATVNNLLSAGLLRNTGTMMRRLHETQHESMRKKRAKMRLLTLASKLISFKITLFDPDLLLMRMSKKLRFLWTPAAVGVLVLMMAGSVCLMLANQASLAERMPDLLGWENLAILWLVMIAVKIVHEFGHGLSCKHYGGEVHEMGAMFILFSPFLFCNASDSWTFQEKKKRLIVNFGGIYLELFLASAAGALWVVTQPGLFNQICFNVMLVCSVITIFFNANPLMKFDGYYALSDWMEVPNLKERGDRALISSAAGLLTGDHGMERDSIFDKLRVRIMFYAVASYIWTFTVAYRMLLAVGKMLEPYGLDRLAQATASLALLTGLVAPPIMVAFYVRKILAKNSDSKLRGTVIKRGLVVAVMLVAVLAVPWAVNVRSSCVIDAANLVRVTAAATGYVDKIEYSDGQEVHAGCVLAALENPDLEGQVRDYELKLAALQAALAAAETEPAHHTASADLRMQEKQLEISLQQARVEKERLVLRSPVAGTVSARGLSDKNGMLIRRGDLFCEILPNGPAKAVVVLGENDAGKVEPGQRASFRLNSLSSRTFEGKVLEVTEQPVARLPHQSLGQHAGGTVPSVLTAPPAGAADANSPVAVPTGQVFAITVAIDDDNGLLRPGMSGRIKIDCGRRSLGATLWEKFTSMLRTDFRL